MVELYSKVTVEPELISYKRHASYPLAILRRVLQKIPKGEGHTWGVTGLCDRSLKIVFLASRSRVRMLDFHLQALSRLKSCYMEARWNRTQLAIFRSDFD